MLLTKPFPTLVLVQHSSAHGWQGLEAVSSLSYLCTLRSGAKNRQFPEISHCLEQPQSRANCVASMLVEAFLENGVQRPFREIFDAEQTVGEGVAQSSSLLKFRTGKGARSRPGGSSSGTAGGRNPTVFRGDDADGFCCSLSACNVA